MTKFLPVIVTSDYSVEIFKYLSLKSILSLSLCCHEWCHYIHEENQHALWKMLYHRYGNNNNNNNNTNYSSNQNWKEQVRELLCLKFALALKYEGSGILTNNDRTMELSDGADSSWAIFPLTKVIDLKQSAGTCFCFEVVLDKFGPKSAVANNYYVTIGVAYWDDEYIDPGAIIGFSRSTGVAFFCGNQLVFKRGINTLTQEAVGQYQWPTNSLKQGDVVGVKVSVHARGTGFHIRFYVNGVERILKEPLGTNITAKHVQPHISCIKHAKLTVRVTTPAELEDRTRFVNRTTEINEPESSTESNP